MRTLVPDKCKDCKHLIISHATGYIRDYGCPVGTCKLVHTFTQLDELRGTYEVCGFVVDSEYCKKEKV